MSNPNIKPRWKPGEAPYADFLKGLKAKDDGSYEQHLADRAARKSMKESWKAVVEHNRTAWITDMNRALAKAMQTALVTGDIDSIKKIADMLNITVKESDVHVEVNSQEVVDAIKDLAGKLPD